MNSKGQGAQFNWIFIIVAGVIILSFFVLFIVKYVELQETKEGVETARSFVNVLVEMEKSSIGSGLIIDDGSKLAFSLNYYANLNVTCDGESSLIIIDGQDLSKQPLQDEIVFAPPFMRVNAMDTWIRPWEYPFFSSNFIYLSKPYKKIYVFFDSTTQELVNDLEVVDPSMIAYDVEVVSVMQDILPGDDVSVLWLSNMPVNKNLLNNIIQKSKKFSFVQVMLTNPANDNPQFMAGKLIFYENGNMLESKFFGEGLLYGALFAETHAQYECMFNRALSRLGKVSEVIAEKISLLLNKFLDPDCRPIYFDLQARLKQHAAGQNMLDVETMIDQNSKLRGRGCPSAF